MYQSDVYGRGIKARWCSSQRGMSPSHGAWRRRSRRTYTRVLSHSVCSRSISLSNKDEHGFDIYHTYKYLFTILTHSLATSWNTTTAPTTISSATFFSLSPTQPACKLPFPIYKISKLASRKHSLPLFLHQENKETTILSHSPLSLVCGTHHLATPVARPPLYSSFAVGKQPTDGNPQSI